MAKKYIYRDKEIYVSSLMGGDTFGTVWQSDSGGTHRIKLTALPVRNTKAAAQKDLNTFAKSKQLKEVME
jgi:hypothetical protein